MGLCIASCKEAGPVSKRGGRQECARQVAPRGDLVVIGHRLVGETTFNGLQRKQFLLEGHAPGKRAVAEDMPLLCDSRAGPPLSRWGPSLFEVRGRPSIAHEWLLMTDVLRGQVDTCDFRFSRN
jgi:hypothetical protein